MHKLSDLKIWNKAMDVAELTYLLSAKISFRREIWFNKSD